MKNSFFFTSFFLDTLDIPEKGYEVHGDTSVPILKLYITSTGIKSFFIRKRVNGKDERFILGQYPQLSVEEARDLAIIKYDKLKNTKNYENRKIKSAKLSAIIKQYLEKRVKREKYGKQVLTRNINRFWQALMPYEMADITSEHIETIHKYIEKYHGPSMANRMLEIIRGVFRYAIQNNYVKENPALKVAKFITSQRHRLLSSTECRNLLSAIKKEKNQNIKNALLMLFFTGQQKSSVLAMRWEQIDFNQNLWINKDLHIALSDSTLVLLENMNQKSAWLFPNRESKTGHLVDLKRAWQRVIKQTKYNNIQIDDIHKTIKYYLEDLRKKTRDELQTFDFEHKLLNEVLKELRIY